MPFTFKFNRKLKPKDWKDIDQVLQLHQLLKDLFQWSMENNRFNMASHGAELAASFQKSCLKEIHPKDHMVITKGWNPTRQFRLLEVRKNRARDNQATIKAIEEQVTQTRHAQILSQPWQLPSWTPYGISVPYKSYGNLAISIITGQIGPLILSALFWSFHSWGQPCPLTIIRPFLASLCFLALFGISQSTGKIQIRILYLAF
ncbi:hypothetical protein O181_015953 [Austropuccinia psidii MF-1]|uniref:Uncharacterized protein n=1 Tax=Austropuccinia psidii MF-1 TaxID=1389203 RepID=A0A9Q3C3E7_9BASI|nr:hypothetical protein [Austropuccinia psidii MF-1]